MLKAALIAAAAMGMCAPLGHAQATIPMGQTQKAAEGNPAEIQMGELAQQRGSSQAVRQYGAALVNDYTKSQKRLKALSGSQFDQEFLEAQIRAHRRELAQFQGEAQAGKDPNVARYAERSVRVLQMHLQMAQDAEKKGE